MHSKYLWIWLSGLAFTLLIVLIPAASTQAHANLIRSTPSSGEVLVQAPGSLQLEFTEAIDPNLFSVKLLDASSDVVAPGPGTLDPTLPTLMYLELPALPDGAYTASWQVRSAVDGHITQGLISFSVGLTSPQESLLPPPNTPDPAFTLPDPLATTTRWVRFLFAALLTGSLSFHLMVLKPASAGQEKDGLFYVGSDKYLLKRLAWVGVIGAAASSVLLFTVQSMPAFDIIPGLSSPLLSILSGRSGLVFGIRLLLLAISAWIIQQLPEQQGGPIGPWLSATGLSLVIQLTFSLQSHSAATGSIVAIGMDWLHHAATAVWIGGLVPLALLLMGSRRNENSQQAFTKLIPRFSLLAILCVILISVSGLFSAFQQVRTLEALLYSSYGRALLIKTGLFFLLMGLGAINLFVLSPRLTSNVSTAIHRLSHTVRAEIFLGTLILLGAGIMAGGSPAYEALQSQKRMGSILDARADRVEMKLYAVPAKVGENELGVDILDRRPGAALGEPELIFRFTPPDPDLGVFQIRATQSNDRRFSARGSYFSMIGIWQVEVILRQAGMDDVRHIFEIPIRADIPDHSSHTSISTDADMLAQGQELYQAYCESCHGPEGKGDGPVAPTLYLPPADLSIHVAPGEHTDQQLIYYISEGFPSSGMPAFKNILTEEEIRLVLQYIKTFAP